MSGREYLTFLNCTFAYILFIYNPGLVTDRPTSLTPTRPTTHHPLTVQRVVVVQRKHAIVGESLVEFIILTVKILFANKCTLLLKNVKMYS